jgi:DNA modification methylase
VLDTFGGAGSTLIACAKHGREARLLEIDPRYCDVVIRRWQEWSGEKAVNEEGRPFEEASNNRLAAVASP